MAALFVASSISTYLLLQGNYTDIRDISCFIYNIRFGLNLTFGFFILLFFAFKKNHLSRTIKIFSILLALWFLIFIYLLEALTSMIIVVIIGLGLMVYLAYLSKNILVKISSILLVIAIPFLLWFSVTKEIKEYLTAPKIQSTQLNAYTAQGNPYTFDTINWGIENGKYNGLYLCLPELKKEWNKRSIILFSGKDKSGQQLSQTLIRYLTSKNLRKDSAGVAALTNIDILRIERGVANHNYIDHPGFHSRLMKILVGYEIYRRTGNANGSSIMQRFVYLKASLKIIQKHFWFGVGTGNVQKAFIKEYQQMNSGLQKKYMHLAHNQFLEAFVAFGIFGFIILLIALFYPPIATKAYQDYYFIVFYAIMLLSMFSDNTLETPDGVFLFAFFSTLLLFGKEMKKPQTHV
ncbi:MAG: O-antigen ligase family protein [Bacteroidales bacterium]|nr:O-antigen ligase family protein [Bacteroidales bacterium]